MNSRIRTRMENALWGLFIGDALAMPVHWYYNRKNIYTDFPDGITDYEAPRHPHPESFMVGMGYHPDVETARKTGRPYDILHEHARFYDTSYSHLEIHRADRESEHGNAVPALEERFHYHHDLERGENTLGAHLVRVLLRSLAAEREYRPDAFLDAFVHHMTTPGLNRDPYSEIYLRRWFENYSRGAPPDACAEHQRRVWSIGSHGGMIRPMALSVLVAENPYWATGVALEHQNLTHRSENVAAALATAVPLLHELIGGGDPEEVVTRLSRSIHLPVVTGRRLYAYYREHGGPGNIPRQEMWRLHTELHKEPFDVTEIVSKTTEEEAIMGIFATACYPEHGLPLALYLALAHRFDLKTALCANANAGGDNVHRGMVLGMILGAATDTIPQELKDGLLDPSAIQTEIDRVLSAVG